MHVSELHGQEASHNVDPWCANVIAASLSSLYGYSLEGACGKLVNQVSAWNLNKNSWTDLHYSFSICCFWTEELGNKERVDTACLV